MKVLCKLIKLLMLGALLTSLSAISMAMGKTEMKSQPTAQKLESAYYWYDGDKRFEVMINPSQIAEFGKGISQLNRTIGAKDVSAKSSSGYVKIWDVSASGGAVKAMTLISGKAISPVFGNTVGTRRALPGGIIVTFADDWDSQRIQKWVAAKGLSVESKLDFGNIYVLTTDAGLSSLSLANQIHESGEVVNAQPNWWKELTMR